MSPVAAELLIYEISRCMHYMDVFAAPPVAIIPSAGSETPPPKGEQPLLTRKPTSRGQ